MLAPSTVLPEYVTVVEPLECECTRNAFCKFNCGLLPAARFTKWLLLTVMLLLCAPPFSQMPRMFSGSALWAFRMLIVLLSINNPSYIAPPLVLDCMPTDDE